MDEQMEEIFLDQIESDFMLLEEENEQAVIPDGVDPRDFKNLELPQDLRDFMDLELIKKNRYHYNPFWEKRTASPGFLWANFQVANVESIRMLKKKIDGKLENARRKNGKNEEIGELSAVLQDVDYGVFIQFYGTGMEALACMGTAAKKVFSMICLQLMGPYGKDMQNINVSWKHVQKMMEEEYWLSKRIVHEEYLKERGLEYSKSFMECISIPREYMSYEIYKRGIRELRTQTVLVTSKKRSAHTAKILYKTKSNGCFLINPLILFNGNRGLLVKSNGTMSEEKEEWIRTVWDDTAAPEEYLSLLGLISVRWLPPSYKTYGNDELKYDFTNKKTEYHEPDRLALKHVLVKKEQGKYTSRGLFVKIYKEGIFPMFTLGKNGILVLVDIFHAMLRNPSKDKVTLRYTDTWFYYKPAKVQKKGSETGRRAAFYKGLNECIAHSLICRSDIPDTYFINPLFFFVGDRGKLRVSSPLPEDEDI